MRSQYPIGRRPKHYPVGRAGIRGAAIRGGSLTPTLARFASTAEQLGADSLWVGDRLLARGAPDGGLRGQGHHPGAVPHLNRSVHRPGRRRDVDHHGRRWAPACSSHPWYPPVQLARQLTSIDVVSGGRLLPGFGIGWSPEEYQAAGRTVHPPRRTARRAARRAGGVVDDESGCAPRRAVVNPGILGRPEAGPAAAPADLSGRVHPRRA